MTQPPTTRSPFQPGDAVTDGRHGVGTVIEVVTSTKRLVQWPGLPMAARAFVADLEAVAPVTPKADRR
jgi:hypothetical protein